MDSKEHSAKPRVWRPAFGGPPSNWSIKVGNDQFQIGFTGFHGSPLNPTNPFKFPESIARLALHFLDFFIFWISLRFRRTCLFTAPSRSARAAFRQTEKGSSTSVLNP